jgi:hypothetical protein
MNDITIAKTPKEINAYMLLSLRAALKLEVLGMKRKGLSANHVVKSQFGFKGNKKEVLEQFTNYLTQEGILVN